MPTDRARLVARLESVINRIDNGDIGFSEAGDWLHNCGDSILTALDQALEYVKEGE